ncbi:hypothetical protein M405DRAFT_886446, partial [Rhizopogon salebrosus TDB-379]
MLNCGIHPYPLKCHQISDHSQMPCQHPYTDMCTANLHKLKRRCHQSKPDRCHFRKEAKSAGENRKRELELKQKLEEEHKRLMQRAEEQLEHDLRMAELDAKLKAEMNMADAQIAQQRANDLKQEVKDIEAAKSNAEKAFVNAQAHASAAFASRTPNATPSSNMQSNSPSPPSNPQSNPTPPSSPSQNTNPSTNPSAKRTPPTPPPKPPKPTSGPSSTNATPTSAASQGRKEQRHRRYHGVEDGRQTTVREIRYWTSSSSRWRINLKFADYTDVELLTILEALVGKRYSGQMKVEDGIRGLKENLIGPDPPQVLPQCASWEKLQKMMGLDSVKESMSLNRVFLGSPGTGKTIVAKLYGQILTELGLLSNGEVVVKNPSHFVGAYLVHSEKNTKAILDSTVHKVPAYMLYSGNSSGSQDQFKTTVIDTMVAEIQSVPGEDRCVLILGYKEQMEDMFQ